MLLTRHGDRASIFKFGTSEPQPLSCIIDDKYIEKYPQLSDFRSHIVKQGQRKGKYTGPGFKGWELYPRSVKCQPSQLTPIGVAQHINNGKYLRGKYFTDLFPDGFGYDLIHVMSTGFTRTFQSAISLLFGFVENLQVSKIPFTKSIHHSNFICNSQFSNNTACGCIYRSLYLKPGDRDAFGLANLAQFSNILGVKLSPQNKLSRLVDSLMPRVCHGKNLDCNNKNTCVNKNLLESLWSMTDDEFFKDETEPNYQNYAHLAAHPFLLEVAEWMRKSVKKETNNKLIYFSAHDRTIEVVLTALGIADGRWTPYASRVVFELFSTRNNKKEYFIRVLFNGEDRTWRLPFCKFKEQENGLCPLELFNAHVEKHFKRHTTKDYNQECGNEKPLFNEKEP